MLKLPYRITMKQQSSKSSIVSVNKLSFDKYVFGFVNVDSVLHLYTKSTTAL